MLRRQSFLSEDFLLETRTARKLYHGWAEKMPIFDYHCHLPPAQIARNAGFENISHAWLAGDHYKWRAMRANGIPERRITGDATDRDRFQAWAETVPYTIGNPLYHWTHLELKRYFTIRGTLLDRDTAERIYSRCTELLLSEDFRVRGLIERMNVKVICTTDDPIDSLDEHETIARDSTFAVRVVPAFRPDRAHAIEDPAAWNAWMGRLEDVVGRTLVTFDDLLEALRERHKHFHAMGCRLSDHGIEFPADEDFTHQEVSAIYLRTRQGVKPRPGEILKFRTAILLELARMDAQKTWTMQLHMGAIRAVNTKMTAALGRDTGYDSIGDFPIAVGLARFLDRLAAEDRLPKTILYCLNPTDNDLIASMIGNFQDATTAGKMQFGSGWWFNDQKDGMQRQMIALANHGLLSRFVGMLTDSRSFLSYPRHEYFRRVLCNLIGGWVDRGEAPHDLNLLGRMVSEICFDNARRYFGIEPLPSSPG